MSASVAVHSYNSALSVSSTQGGSYTDMTEVLDIADDFNVKEVKTTHLKSDSAAHEYIPGLIESGTVTLTLNFYKTQYNTLIAALRTAYWWKITDSDGSVTNFKGFYRKINKRIVEDDRITVAVEIKRTGLPTFTAAA